MAAIMAPCFVKLRFVFGSWTLKSAPLPKTCFHCIASMLAAIGV